MAQLAGPKTDGDEPKPEKISFADRMASRKAKLEEDQKKAADEAEAKKKAK